MAIDSRGCGPIPVAQLVLLKGPRATQRGTTRRISILGLEKATLESGKGGGRDRAPATGPIKIAVNTRLINGATERGPSIMAVRATGLAILRSQGRQDGALIDEGGIKTTTQRSLFIAAVDALDRSDFSD